MGYLADSTKGDGRTMRTFVNLIPDQYEHVYNALTRDSSMYLGEFSVEIKDNNQVYIHTDNFDLRVGYIDESLATLLRLKIVYLFTYRINENELILTFKRTTK